MYFVLDGTRSTQGQRLTALELRAWRGFLRTHAALFPALDDELDEAHRLPLAQYDVLLRLSEQPDGRMRLSELAALLLRPRNSLTRAIDALEKRGLVAREACVNDRRGFNAVLTVQGRGALKEAQATHLAGVRERFLDRLSDEQFHQLADIWAQIEPSALDRAPDE